MKLDRGVPPQEGALRGAQQVPPLTAVISRVFKVRMKVLLLCDARNLAVQINERIVVVPCWLDTPSIKGPGALHSGGQGAMVRLTPHSCMRAGKGEGGRASVNTR